MSALISLAFILLLGFNGLFEKSVISNHSIFRHDNFIGCFSADKIKMSARK